MTTDVREAFEAWCKEEGFILAPHPVRTGMYDSHYVQGMWEAYQKGRADERAALKPASAPKKCCVCGTTENLRYEGLGSYRCDNPDCMVF